MKRGMTIEYLKRRADFSFKVDFRVNSAIVTRLDHIMPRYSKKWTFFCVKFLKVDLFLIALRKVLKSRPFLIALRINYKRCTILLRKKILKVGIFLIA